ncbi:phosphoribosylamine--glycine ligase [Candidatus Micrarchaeota archaeon]|nr:phosphoribosylamine--glycine ligase [Candidatus Micrarchaeota archaeon]MBU2476982.1 phosphoribosylamine--glycine ligase [Candidatus Micrarchaeota archaeon]
MKILLIGSTARADCIAEAIIKSKTKPELYAIMPSMNPGVKQKAKELIAHSVTDFSFIINYAKKIKPDFAVLGPDDPIAMGLANELEKIGVPSFGPKKEVAKIESSKSFARELMKKHSIEGLPKFRVFSDSEGMKDFASSLEQIVIKPDGLTGGKGVKVQGDHFDSIEQGLSYADSLLAKGKVVIEEKLEGEEFSLQSFCDGKTVLDCIPVQDHKRAFEGDLGPNCGGMGSYSCENHLLPFLKEKDLKQAHKITEQVALALKKETGTEFKGILYGGFILTKKGVKLIEYNARFGDPEVMNVLPLMKSDFVEVCKAVIEGKLNEISLEFEQKASVCKYVVPEGYPLNAVKNQFIEFKETKAKHFFGAIDEKNGHYLMTGSRAMAFVGIGENLEKAEKISQNAVNQVKGKVFFRKDIGTRELIEKRVNHMKTLLW